MLNLKHHLKPLPVKRELYDHRYKRLAKLIRLDAPPSIITSEAFILLEAAYGSYLAVLRLAFGEWREHVWIDYVDRPVARFRCRAWCWWNEKPESAYWELREMEDEEKLPVCDRMPKRDEDNVN